MSVGVEVIEILIVGTASSGKTTLLETLCRTVNQDGDWNAGRLRIDETLDARFTEPPHAAFMWLREIIEDTEASACIVMIDSARPECFGETVGILQALLNAQPDLPMILVANKQDQPHAWSADDIRLGLRIPSSIPVVPCVATDRSQVKRAVITLFNTVFAG